MLIILTSTSFLPLTIKAHHVATMESSGSFHTPGGIVQTPGNNIVDLGSGGQTHGSADSSELSLNDPARRVERYDTPPYVQIVYAIAYTTVGS